MWKYQCTAGQLSVKRSQSSQASRSKMFTPAPTRACSRSFQRACHAWESVSQWIINGCNVMTDDSERPVPSPSLTRLCRLGFHSQEETEGPRSLIDYFCQAHFCCPLRSVRPELSSNLSQSLSPWPQSHRTSPSFSEGVEPAHCPPSSQLSLGCDIWLEAPEEVEKVELEIKE